MYSGTDILIVEDSPTQAAELQALLEAHQFVVRVARNGVDALAQVASSKPTIIISDIVMPLMDGYGLCKQLKASADTQHIPIVLVTTLSDPRDVVHGLACGADNFILKPYDERYLLSRLRYLLANMEMRHHERVAMGIEVMLEGERHFITAARQQILDLLISTYEQGIRLNSELKAKHIELEQFNRLLNGLLHFANGLAGPNSERDVIAEAVTRIRQFPQVEAACLLMRSGGPDAQPFRVAGTVGELPALPQLADAFNSCPCSRSLAESHSNEAVVIEGCTVPGLGATHVSVPIRIGHELIGLLNIWQRAGEAVSPDALKALTAMSQQLATALARARLFDGLEELVADRTRDLRAEISERQRTELALQRSESLLRLVLETLPVGVLVSDVQGERLLHNREVERIWGRVPQLSDWRDGRCQGQDSETGEPIAAERWPVMRALRQRQPVIGDVNEIVGADGNTRTILNSAVPLFTDNGMVDCLILVFQDISNQIQLGQELRIRNLAIESSNNAVIITDHRQPDQPIVYVNHAFEAITGYSRDEVLGRNCRFLQGGDQQQPGLEQIRRVMQSPDDIRVLLRNYRKDGSLFWNDLRLAPVFDSRNQVSHFIGVLNDVTEEKRYRDELERQANFDSLTGLPNRNLLMDRINQAIAMASRRRERFGLVFLDLDHFKLVNDSRGHQVGDALLQEVAKRLELCIRKADTVARLGGDEFVLLLTNIQSVEGVAELLAQIRLQLSRAIVIDSAEFYVTSSFGFCMYPDDGTEPATLLRNADTALYQAKQDGRNRGSAYTAQMNARILRRFNLERDIRVAIENREFELLYQPQLQLETGKLCGFEALIRWRRNGEQVSPTEFIPLAEELGLVAGIDTWVLTQACRQIGIWSDAGLDCPPVAVNLSPRSFLDPAMHVALIDIIVASGIAPGQLKIELTESVWVQESDAPLQLMQALKAQGIAVAIDDFGTGYSALSYLHRFEFSQLKIDRAFVNGALRRAEDASLVKAMISIGHNLGMQVIAEGVETEAQLSLLIAMGCDEIQGYFYSPPLPVAACDLLLREDSSFSLPQNLPQQGEWMLLVAGPERNRHDQVWSLAANVASRLYYVDSTEDLFRLLASLPIGVVLFDTEFLAGSGAGILRKVKSLAPLAVRGLQGPMSALPQWRDLLTSNELAHVMVWPSDTEHFLQQLREAFQTYELQRDNARLRSLLSATA